MAKRVKVMAATPGAAAARDYEMQRPSPAEELTERDIAARAYALWEARGCAGGSADEDWYRALRELVEERQK